MNKLISSIVIIALIAFSAICVFAFDIPLSQPPAPKATDPACGKVYIDEDYCCHISVVGRVGEWEVSSLASEFSKLPLPIQDDFISRSGTIYITSLEIGEVLDIYYGMDIEPNEDFTGFFIENASGCPEIWISGKPGAINSSALHEFGHFFDYNGGWLSSSDEFGFIYGSENHFFGSYFGASGYFTSDRTEYFAETFSCYINSPELLKEHCPLTFAFLALGSGAANAPASP